MWVSQSEYLLFFKSVYLDLQHSFDVLYLVTFSANFPVMTGIWQTCPTFQWSRHTNFLKSLFLVLPLARYITSYFENFYRLGLANSKSIGACFTRRKANFALMLTNSDL